MQEADETASDRDGYALEGFFASKLQPPPVRSGLVSRPALVDRLATSNEVPIASVIAPAGYGKTTVLSEWAHRDASHIAWLSIDHHDNDLSTFGPYLASALDRVEPIDPSLLRPAAHRGSVAATAARLADAIAGMQHPVVLVLDHVELLRNDECTDALAELALHFPERSRLVLASRRELPLPVPRLRARGDLVEIGVDDLAMTPAEAQALLAGAGVAVNHEEVDKLVERTEGWPVGLYLAALAMKAGGSPDGVGVPLSGDDKLVADYLRSEVLANLSGEEVEFLTRTSVLERMTATLCDEVLGRSGSREMLDALARSNLLLVGLDRRGDWFRYHHLFRDLLRAELERREPDCVPVLQLRAAQWCERAGLPELAIEHAQAAGDRDLANRLVLANVVGVYATGRGSVVRRWLRWFDDGQLLPEYPGIAVVGALVYSSSGMTAEADYWSTLAEHPRADLAGGVTDAIAARAAPTRVMPDGSTLESWRAVLRVLQSRDGVEGIRRDAAVALAGLAPGSGYRGVVVALVALCDLLESDDGRADAGLSEAADLVSRAHRMPALVGILSERGLIAAARKEWDDAGRFADQALETVRAWHLDDYTESALALALAAGVAAARGDGQAAHAHLARAARLRPRLSHTRPITSVQTLLAMGRTYAALDDTAGAREVLRQARELLRRRPDLGNLVTDADELANQLDTMRTATVGASSLTAAELRLVPYLATHLTFPQVAERLYISRNTVKSQAISIYQKLGVSSRADAVERLGALGLLDHWRASS